MSTKSMAVLSVCVLVGVVGLIAVGLFAYPQYDVYRSRLRGEAAKAQAESEKLILIEQAKAELEAAKSRAEAIKIVGEVAQKYPEYRQQEFIGAFANALEQGKIEQIIYVPTEASIPIIEARDNR